MFPPGCLVPPRQLQPGLSFPITSGSLCFDPSHHPFHVGLPNDFFLFPLPARTHTVLCSRPPPHALPSLSAQAQQWGPAARGPAPQGEVPGDLCDPCQRMLGLPTAPSPKGPRCLLAATPPGPGRSATLAVHQATAGDAHPHFVFWGAVTYKLRKGGRLAEDSCPRPSPPPSTLTVLYIWALSFYSFYYLLYVNHLSILL